MKISIIITTGVFTDYFQNKKVDLSSVYSEYLFIKDFCPTLIPDPTVTESLFFELKNKIDQNSVNIYSELEKLQLDIELKIKEFGYKEAVSKRDTNSTKIIMEIYDLVSDEYWEGDYSYSTIERDSLALATALHTGLPIDDGYRVNFYHFCQFKNKINDRQWTVSLGKVRTFNKTESKLLIKKIENSAKAIEELLKSVLQPSFIIKI